MGAREPADIELQGRLAQARQMLETGDVEPARELASAVLAEAEALQDTALQAQSLMALAHYDRVTGRFRRAVDAAQRAVLLFQRVDGSFEVARLEDRVRHQPGMDRLGMLRAQDIEGQVQGFTEPLQAGGGDFETGVPVRLARGVVRSHGGAP